MESTALVSESRLSSAKLLEIIGRFGDGTSIKTHFDTAGRFSSNTNVKIDRVGDFGFLLAKDSIQEPSDHRQGSRSRDGGWLDSTCSGRSEGRWRCKGGSILHEQESSGGESREGASCFHVDR